MADAKMGAVLRQSSGPGADDGGFDAQLEAFVKQESEREATKQELVAEIDRQIAALQSKRALLTGEAPPKRRGRKPGSTNAAKKTGTKKTAAKKKTGKRGRPKGSGKKKAARSGSVGNG
jgi:hypothetical protein